ncbi:MAG: Na+/H+ antiporter NhaA, partial [Novosphingobium sp.]
MAGNSGSTGFLRQFFRSEAAPGIVLMVCAAVALVLANSPLAEPWHDLFYHRLAWTPIAKLYNLHLWINDALMAIFFLLVGLEIEREIYVGELSKFRQAILPIIAAVGGMV